MYKRQVGYALCKTLEAEGPLKALRMAMDFYNRYNVDLSSLIPVSYTHLDVYKRQSKTYANNRPIKNS